MKKLLFGILAMMMIFAIVGCDTQGGTPEWTEVFSLDGLEGTWSYLTVSYVITKDNITAKQDGVTQTELGYPMPCEDFEAALGQGQLSLFVNRDKTKLKFVIASGETKIEQIYTKQ